MSRGGAKRRIKVRRKRKNDDAAEASDILFEGGGCAIEAVVSATVLVGVLLVPGYLALG